MALLLKNIGLNIRLPLSIEWNSIRLSGPAHGIVTKTVHKTLPGGGGVRGVRGVGGQWGWGGGSQG